MKSNEVLNSSVLNIHAAHRGFPAGGKKPQTGQSVLILGGDADTRLLYKSLLEIWDYTVAEAESIEEVFTITGYFHPQLILMDCSVRFENNLEAIEKIRSNPFLRNTPLILASGYSQPQIRGLALAAGADDFLVKPLNFDDLKNNLQIYASN